MQAGNVPDMFQSWGGGTLKRAGRRRPRAGHHRRRRATGSATSTRPPPGSTRSTASSTACRTTSAWSGSGTTRTLFDEGRDRRAAGDVGRVPRRRPEAQGRRDHPDRRRREGQVARHVLVGEPVAAHRRQGRDGPGRRGRLFDSPGVRQGRRGAQEADRPEAVPGRLPGRAVGRRRRRGRDDGQRQGGDGPDGPVGAGDVRGQHQGQEGLVDDLGWFPFPTVDGGAGQADRAVRRRRRLRVRQGRAAGGRRLRSSSWSAPRSPTRPARAAAILPVDEGHRDARSPTEHEGRAGQRAARRRSCSCTSTRPTRRPSARPSTTPSRAVRRQGLPAGRRRARSRMPPRPDDRSGSPVALGRADHAPAGRGPRRRAPARPPGRRSRCSWRRR